MTSPGTMHQCLLEQHRVSLNAKLIYSVLKRPTAVSGRGSRISAALQRKRERERANPDFLTVNNLGQGAVDFIQLWEGRFAGSVLIGEKFQCPAPKEWVDEPSLVRGPSLCKIRNRVALVQNNDDLRFVLKLVRITTKKYHTMKKKKTVVEYSQDISQPAI